MIIVSDYRGYRIEVEAIKAEGAAADGRYNAAVRMRRLFSRDKPRVERVTCLKLTPDFPSTPANCGPSAGSTCTGPNDESISSRV